MRAIIPAAIQSKIQPTRTRTPSAAPAVKRYPDWQRRLDAHFTAALKTPFEWGVFDCALAACQAVAAQTGVNPGADLQGEYETEEEAGALMALFGQGASAGIAISLEGSTRIERDSPQSAANDLGELAAAIAESHGFREVRHTYAHRGDVVLVDNTVNGISRALGTVDLSGRFAWCVGERGFVRVPMSRWLRAWSIG